MPDIAWIAANERTTDSAIQRYAAQSQTDM